MGASHSTPPPLVEVNAPGGKVLVPPGTAFTVHPSSYGPVYTPCCPPRRGNRPRPRRQVRRPQYGYSGPGYGSHNINIPQGSEDSESTFEDMVNGMRRQGSKGYPGPMGGMGPMGRRGGGPGYFDGGDMRPRSAPEMPMGTYPGIGGMPMGMPGSPRMGMGGMGMGGLGSGGMGAPPPVGMPPEYTSNPSMPRFGGGGGMPGAGAIPYANYPGRPPSLSSSGSPSPQQQPRRPSGRPPGYHERVPMGAYADTEKRRKPSRSRTEPQASTRLNRGQPTNKKAGPSGKEWLEGDAFLDACTCTTDCNCRKSQRVLYRSRNDRRKGSGSDSEDEEYGSGEIRYILKENLGKNCGDHSGCRKSESDSEKEEKSKKKKDKKEEKRRKEEFEGFKDDLMEALDERFEDIKKASQQRGNSASPAQPSFGGPGMGPSPFIMNGANMDPRMAQQMGKMGGDPYSGMGMPGMGGIPPGITNLTGKRPMGPSGMGMGGMGAGGGMGFEDDMSDMDPVGPMNMGHPYMQAGMMNPNAMRPDLMSHHGAKVGGRFGSGGMGFDREQMAMYANAMRGCRGGMGGSRGGRRPSYMPESESEDFDLRPPMRSSMRQRAGRDRAGRGGRAADHEDEDISRTRGLGSPLRRKNVSQDRDRGKQPRVSDDDDAY